MGSASWPAMTLASTNWEKRSWACLILERDSGRMPGFTCAQGHRAAPSKCVLERHRRAGREVRRGALL